MQPDGQGQRALRGAARADIGPRRQRARRKQLRCLAGSPTRFAARVLKDVAHIAVGIVGTHAHRAVGHPGIFT